MKRIETVFVIALLLFVSVSNAQKPRYVKSDKYEGVVFINYSGYAFEYVGREGLKHQYVPTDKEIASAEKRIEKSIVKLLSDFKKHSPSFKDGCDIPNNLFKYKRHYYGYWSNDEKIISIYLFQETDNRGWKKAGIRIVEDGGCNYIYLKYSITKDKIFDFYMKY